MGGGDYYLHIVLSQVELKLTLILLDYQCELNRHIAIADFDNCFMPSQ